MRLIEAGQTGLEPMTLQIDNAKGLTPELSNEQPFAGRIESHMVNAAFDGPKGNFLLEREFGNCFPGLLISRQDERDIGVEQIGFRGQAREECERDCERDQRYA